MVKNFEDITSELTKDELNLVKPIMHSFVKNHVGKENIINTKEIIRKMKESGYKINDSRLRKIVNYIRSNSIAPICSNSKGYWLSNNEIEIKEEILSLNQRASGIKKASEGLENFLKNQK